MKGGETMAIIQISLQKKLWNDTVITVSSDIDTKSDDMKECIKTVNELFNNAGELPPQE